ncbi:hypothetical protein E4U09_002542 [Claviceps aff. purpurea]|uniref:Uncharacterized protein n=1 Tax=Claviceps aff. purpurea TaxID=1967640 RepID=A0A9P7QFP0_9HYPO|nr:hypothetical protein E4U09_002542 [Claviceps aff. purpurea]
MKSDTEAELDGASAVDVKADVKPTEDTGCEVRESFEVEVEASLQGILVVDPTEASGNLSFKVVWYAVLDERELELAGGGIDVTGMLSCVLGEFELIAAAVLEAGFAVDAEDAAEDAVEAAGILACVLSASPKVVGPVELMSAVAVEKVAVVDAEAAVEASGVLLTRDRNLCFKLVGYAVLEERELKLAGDGIDAAGMLSCVLAKFELIAAAVLETGFAVDAEVAAEDATEDAAEVAAEAGGMLDCVLSVSPKVVGPVELMSAVAVEKVSVIAAVEASGVLLTRDRNLSFKLVGYAVLEGREGELDLAEDAVDSVDAAGTLDCELDKLELIDAAMLEAGFAVDAEDAAEDAAEVAVEAAGILACVLRASPKLVGPVELMSAIAVEKVSVVDAEAAVESSGVLTRVGNLSFKLVGYAVLEERERELDLAEDAVDAIDAAGMLDCESGKLELIDAAMLEAGFAVDAEFTAEVPAEVAPEAADITACVLSASLELEDSIKLIGAVSVETVSVVDPEASVEASGVLTRVGNLSFKLVGYAMLEEGELELAEYAVDAAGMLDCELGKLELIDAAVLEAKSSDNRAEAAMLVCVLGAPFELSAAAVFETDAAVENRDNLSAGAELETGAVDKEAVDTLKLPTNLEAGNGVDAELICPVRDPSELDAMSEVEAVLDAEGKLDPLARDKLETGAELEADKALKTSTEADATLKLEI